MPGYLLCALHGRARQTYREPDRLPGDIIRLRAPVYYTLATTWKELLGVWNGPYQELLAHKQVVEDARVFSTSADHCSPSAGESRAHRPPAGAHDLRRGAAHPR